MLKVGFIGWRGMVGSVLMERMKLNQDFKKIQPYFFSTSNVGGETPNIGSRKNTLLDAYKLEDLINLDCIVSMQGSEYTNKILPQLQKLGYLGYWIDASSAIRMNDRSVIILDPVNYPQIEAGLNAGVKLYSGGNCTVSLMLMALSGLFKYDMIEWVNTQTYQAASGAGANNMRELIHQYGSIYNSVSEDLINSNAHILEIDNKISQILRS